MSIGELRRAITATRDIGKTLAITYPLVLLARGRVGLATRDLGIDRATWTAFTALVRAEAHEHGRVDDAFLAATLARLRPVAPPVPPRAMRSLVAATLARVAPRRR